MNKIKSTKGITLISLVVTIIILLILAGVTIATLMGDNGLINKAKDAKIKTEIASIKERIQLEIFAEQAEGKGSITKSTLETILDKYGTINYEEDGETIKSITTDEGNYEIAISEIYGNTVTDDVPIVPEGPTFTTVANAPDIDGFNKSNTYYVAWDLNEAGTEYIPNEIQMESENGTKNFAPNNWYDYTQGVNHWANVKTTGGGNDCYWVWIPRYAYKVPTRSSAAETIEIKFLKDDTNIPIGETTEITNTTPTPETWVVHPAFTNEGNGGFGNLTGIWVAKYEASSNSSFVVENPTESQLAIDGGSDADTDLQVRVIPNVTSWRKITVNNIFTVCRNLTGIGNSLENTSSLNSHMMKNTEWGAVAYLSRSVYGINSEVWNNPYYNNTTNYSPITGLCGNKTNGKDNATTSMSNTVKYNEIGGGNASTTGNVYGIYDMAGGAWEYVAGIYTGGASNDNRSNLWDSNNLKYVDQYTETTGSQSTYYGNTNKYGDAVYETSSSGDSNTGSWDSSYSNFPNSSHPVFKRGGLAYNGSSAGVFAFKNNAGGAYTNNSFRPVVLSSQP